MKKELSPSSGRLREETSKILHAALMRRRRVVTISLARLIYGRLNACDRGESSRVHEAVWQPIASLSQFRQIVGGRFQSIKDRWLRAGLPLREHRGDKAEWRGQLDPVAWDELCLWIRQQGFEVRVNRERPENLFEVAKRGE